MRENRITGRKSAGFTLITTLAFSLIVGTVLAGVGTVAMSHYSRSHTEGDYANAVAMADAGINYEINYISKKVTGGTFGVGAGDQFGAPHVSNEPFATGVPGHFSVYVCKWTAAGVCDTSQQWLGIGDVCVSSTGTVNNISRTAQVHGGGESVFSDYSVYSVSTNSSKWHGLGASGKTGVDGNYGTNGPVTLNGAAGSSAFTGTLSMNGSGARPVPSGSNVVSNPNPIVFPTVDQVANGLFPGGLTYLQTHNSNSSIMMLKTSDPTLATEPTIAGLTLADVQSKMTPAGFTTASRTLSTLPMPVTTDTSLLDKGNSATPRFVTDGQGVNGAKPLFFPPGDYYLSDFNPGTAIVALTHLGTVRIWVDSSGTSGDDLMHDTVLFTDSTAQSFKIFFNKCEGLSMHGGSQFHASFYGVKNCADTSQPSITMSGGNHWFGSVIAESFDVGGNSRITFMTNGNTAGDPAPWFGFKDNWKEVLAPNAQKVFSDGTSN